MNPFRITCTTCRARIKIVDPSAIGDIIACPKCNSMVQATPPEGWSPDGPAVADSIVLGGSAVVAGVSSPAVKTPRSASVAKSTAGRAVPPPLPTQAAATADSNAARPKAPALSAAAATSGPKTPVSDVGLDLSSAAAPGIRWFWPALTSATVMGLGIAALVIWVNQKDKPDPVFASAATTSSTALPAPPASNAEQKPPAAAAEKKADADVKPLVVPQKQPTQEDAAPKTEPKSDKPAAGDAPAKKPMENQTAPAPADGAKPRSVAERPQPHPAETQPIPMKEPPVPPPAAGNTEPAAVADVKPPQAPADNPTPEKPVADPALAADPPAAPPVRPSVERVQPRDVDVETHLTDPLAGVSFRGTPLVQVLAELSQWSTIPISFDADALAEFNVSPVAPVTLRLKDTTVAGALDEALIPLHLTYYTVGRQLVIGRVKQGESRTVRYSVADLSGDSPERKAQFEALVHAMVEPAAWKEAGGAATSRWADGLVIEAGDSVHSQMLVFCEKLRNARRLPLKSHGIDPSRFSLTPRSAAAESALGEPVTVNYARPEPLGRVVAYLQNATKSTLLIDQAALAEQRTSPETAGILIADAQPLGQALASLLEPMELTWRVVGERTIEITTPQAAARHGDVEFYPAAELLAGTSGDALAARLERELSASAAGDQPIAKPAIRFDAPSRTLIVRAPQSTHRRIAAVLSGWRVARQ